MTHFLQDILRQPGELRIALERLRGLDRPALSDAAAVIEILAEGHAAERTAVDAGDAVLAGKPLVDKSVIRVEQVHHIAVFPDDALKEHLGFLTEGLANNVDTWAAVLPSFKKFIGF